MNMLRVRNFKDLSIVPVMKDLLETERTVKVRTVLYWSQIYCKTKNSNFLVYSDFVIPMHLQFSNFTVKS